MAAHRDIRPAATSRTPTHAAGQSGLGVLASNNIVRRPGIGCGACDIAGAGERAAPSTPSLPNRARNWATRSGDSEPCSCSVQLGCHQCVGDDSITHRRTNRPWRSGQLRAMSKRRDVRRNRTGRRWIEHQPGIVRPRRDGRIERLGCADPANLDFRGHAVSRGSGSAAPACVGIDQVADPQAARSPVAEL